MNDKAYWLGHVKKLATDNIKLREKVRKLTAELEYLRDEEKHLSEAFRKQNAALITLFIESGKEIL